MAGLIYLYEENAGKQSFSIKGELYKYLVKVRRHKEGDELGFRNKEDIKTLHLYKITAIEPRALHVEKISSQVLEIKAKQKLHVAWCIIDSKSVEKVLASLNEIGVAKISFIYCDRSQKNFKPDFKRYERILQASNQQCGRTQMMEFDIYENIADFIHKFPDTKVFDFTDKILEDGAEFKRVLIGCEGGFSEKEKELLKSQEVFRLNTPMILRSETAVLAVASKVIL
ncbi:16S rRNA (uracil(1498)-N(3))-methyltransferase [Sulfurimonas autotrophica]|uniref:16S rRNA (uracil(1498)-N(3))-methyltransferase n=1 Tax=Sulfurimonas autotrophica TaxID=202747 RepID=UPI001FE238F4|nr:16S rRNA (uracil(1498)-N(3))-methyltransferase [Sulfurimonas autotrophica]